MGRIIPAFAQFFDGEGDPLVDGWLRFLVSGSNNTDKDTFNDASLSILNANPLQLDAEGRCPDVFGLGDYRVISYHFDPEDETNPGEQIQVKDPVTAQFAGETGSGGTGIPTWSSIIVYALNDIVYYNGKYYSSLNATNLNQNPEIETAYWEVIEWLHIWNATVTYNDNDLVRYDDYLYFSIQGSNLNQQPDESPSYWYRISGYIIESNNKTDDYEVLPTEFDQLFILGSGTAADKTFTLPVMAASMDHFRLWVYNASDYNLTVQTQGGSTIWLETDLTIEKGAWIELDYVASYDHWLVKGNAGTLFGGQILGTATTPIDTLYLDTLIINNGFTIPTDEYLYFGDSSESSIRYSSGDISLYLNSTVAIDLNATTDINFTAGNDCIFSVTGDLVLNVGAAQDIFFQFNSIDFWQMADTGELLPGASNPNPDIGSASAWIDGFYGKNFYADALGRFDIDGELFLYHNSFDGYLTCNTGNLRIAVTGTDDLYFITDFGTMAVFNDIGDAYFYKDILLDTDGGNIWLGADQDLRIQHTGTVGLMYCDGQLYIGTNDSNHMYFVTNGIARWYVTNAGQFAPQVNNTYNIGSASLRVANIYAVNGNFSGTITGTFSGTATFSGDIKLNDNINLYLGTDNDASFVWNAAANRLYTYVTNDWVITVDDDLYVDAGGTIYLFDAAAFRISSGSANCGSSGTRWSTVYCVTLDESSDIRLKQNIEPSFLGLDFINALNPIAYNFDTKLTRHGLAAQQVLEAIESLGYKLEDFAAISNDNDNWGLSYTQFIGPIINAIQELSRRIDDKTD